MKEIFVLFSVVYTFNVAYGQTNLDFEEWNNSDLIHLKLKSWTVSCRPLCEGLILEKDSEIKYSGNFSLRLNGSESGKGNMILLSQTFPANYEGSALSFELLCRGNIESFKILAYFMDHNRKFISTRASQEQTTPDSLSGWQRKYVQAVIPKNASSMTILIRKTGNEEVWIDKATVSIDDVEISKVPQKKRYVAESDTIDKSHELPGLNKVKTEDLYWYHCNKITWKYSYQFYKSGCILS